jgi:inosine-uridine nucleoside N-ribohydrolase
MRIAVPVGMAFAMCAFSATANASSLIIDTDIFGDVDDVGAIAIANAMADNGETELLAIVVNTHSRWSAPCAGVLTQFYGRPRVPLGAIKPNTDDVGSYDQRLVTMFPTPVKDGNLAPEAVATYRKILASAASQSVSIASIGFLTNLSALLQSSADASSPLDGRSLVAEAVAKLVVMGGGYPSGQEYNFYNDPPAAAYVVAHWPTPIVFSGSEVGATIISGNTLDTSVPADNPVRVAYDTYVGSGAGRSSWDLTAVLYAVRGGGGLFAESGQGGSNTVAADGSNVWQPGDAGGQRYLVKTASDSQIADVLNQLLVQPPHLPPPAPEPSSEAGVDGAPESESDAGVQDATSPSWPGEAAAGDASYGGGDAAASHAAAVGTSAGEGSCGCVTATRRRDPLGPGALAWLVVVGLGAGLRRAGALSEAGPALPPGRRSRLARGTRTARGCP